MEANERESNQDWDGLKEQADKQPGTYRMKIVKLPSSRPRAAGDDRIERSS